MTIAETERLIIREYTSKDRLALEGILTDPKTMSFWPAPYDQAGVAVWLNTKVDAYKGSGRGRFAVILRETQEVIGDAGVVEAKLDGKAVWDLGYIIHADHWGKRYGTEAARAVLDGVFRYTDTEEVVAHFEQAHQYSRRVAEQTGLRFDHSFVYAKNGGKTHDMYKIDRAAFINLRRERLVSKLGGTVEKQNWLGLATSYQMDDRLLAMETATAIKEQIQPELLYWFCNTRNLMYKMKLYRLLDGEYLKMAEVASDFQGLPPLDGDESFRFFMASPDKEAMLTQAILEARRTLPEDRKKLYALPEGKLAFVFQYSQIKGIPLAEAKEILANIFSKARSDG